MLRNLKQKLVTVMWKVVQVMEEEESGVGLVELGLGLVELQQEDHEQVVQEVVGVGHVVAQKDKCINLATTSTYYRGNRFLILLYVQ